MFFCAQSREDDGNDIIIISNIKCVPGPPSHQSLSFLFRMFLSLIQMLFCAQRREDEGDNIITIISSNNIKCVPGCLQVERRIATK